MWGFKLQTMKVRAATALPGFALSGFLLALLGASLPGWDYHVTEHHALAGWLFFALSLGVAAAGEVRRRLLQEIAVNRLRLGGCFLAAVPLLVLGFLPSPIAFAAQFSGWAVIGFAAGLINISLFESIHQSYSADPASTVTRAGIYFGAGCLASALAVAAAIRWGFVSQILGPLALIPVLFGIVYLRLPVSTSLPAAQHSFRETLREFSKPGALIFAALLLFQSGSEWTVAGWLPLFLTHRLGISPETALWMLSVYWLALLLGRIANVYLLSHVRHGRVLFSTAAAALLGCVLLVLTDNILGAATAILLLGGGFAAVYPLLAEKMGHRFPYYHPGVFNSIFSVALAGGMLFPWLAGLLAESVSLTAIMAIPAIGVFLVAALLLVLWLESKVTGR